MKYSPNPNAFAIAVRVYYEDTDAGGVVYYANYLKYFERCRSDWMRQMGLGQTDIAEMHGVAFVVRSAQIEYLRPARLDDWLTIGLEVEKLGRAQVVFRQHIRRDTEELVTGTVQVACVDVSSMKPSPIPPPLRTQLEALQ